MKIVVAGGSGFIGRRLTASLRYSGHEVIVLSRKIGPGFSRWNPEAGILDASLIDGAGAVINLTGEPIAGLRWTHKKKQKIIETRLKSTNLLRSTIAQCSKKPGVFLCASAIGYYGDRGEEILDESSSAGRGFLTEVCQSWEKASGQDLGSSVRVVNARLGMVLGKGGGALMPLLPLYKWGLGGPVGNGRQFMSWIALDDAVAILKLLIHNEEFSGPVNVVSPNPMRNLDFVQTLGGVLHRWAKISVPAWALKSLMGEMAKELVLSSSRVRPGKLLMNGYPFLFPNLEEALRASI